MTVPKPIVENTVMYGLLALVVTLIAIAEIKDTKCPTGTFSKWKDCSGIPMVLKDTVPKDSDTCDKLLNKIDKASKAEIDTIKWRKSVILAFILSAVMWGIIYQLCDNKGALPQWQVFYITMLCSSAILYFAYNYFSYHMYEKQSTAIIGATKRLRPLCGSSLERSAFA